MFILNIHGPCCHAGACESSVQYGRIRVSATATKRWLCSIAFAQPISKLYNSATSSFFSANTPVPAPETKVNSHSYSHTNYRKLWTSDSWTNTKFIWEMGKTVQHFVPTLILCYRIHSEDLYLWAERVCVAKSGTYVLRRFPYNYHPHQTPEFNWNIFSHPFSIQCVFVVSSLGNI